jgi:hypothetical protein
MFDIDSPRTLAIATRDGVILAYKAVWGAERHRERLTVKMCPHRHRTERRARACRRGGWYSAWSEHPAGRASV